MHNHSIFVFLSCAVCACVSHSFAAFPSSSTTRGFDFGKPDSEVRPGFVRITEDVVYSAKTGCGFVSKSSLTDFFWSHATYGMSKGQKQYWGKDRDIPAPCYTNALSSDGLRGKAPATFRVDLPNGRYRLHFIFGDPAAGGPGAYDTTLTANGSPLDTIKLHGRYHYEVRTYEVDVTKGKLEIEFSTSGPAWLVNALAVYADADREVVDPLLRDIELDIFFLPRDRRKDWQLVLRPKQTPLPLEIVRRFEKQGFVPFIRDYMTEVFPEDVPTAVEIGTPAFFTVVPGLRTQFTFSLRTLREIGGLGLEWTDLTGPAGGMIPRDRITPQAVRCLHAKNPATHSYSMKKGGYVIKPEVLDRRIPRYLPADATQRFWFTVMPPDTLPPGEYRGRVTITAADSAPHVVSVRARVVGMKLPPRPDCFYGFYVNLPRSPDNMRHIVRDFRDHLLDLWVTGLFSYKVDEQRKPHVDGSTMQAFMDVCRAENYEPRKLVWEWNGGQLYRAYRNARLPKQIKEALNLPQEYFDGMAEVSQAIGELCKENNWPEVISSPLDEPYDPQFIKYAIRVYEATRKVAPDVPLYCTVHTDNVATLRPHLDVLCFNGGSAFNYEEFVSGMAGTGPQQVWLYQNYLACSSRNEVAFARFLTGFYNWRLGIRGSMPYAYGNKVGNPFSNFGHFYRGGGVVFPSSVDDAPLSSPCLEGYTQGIIDARAIRAVEELAITLATHPGARQREISGQVKTELEAVKASVPGAFEFLQRYEGGQKQNYWPNLGMDRCRLRALLLVRELQDVRDGDGTALARFPFGFSEGSLFPCLIPEGELPVRKTVLDGFEPGISSWDKGDPNLAGTIPELTMRPSTRFAANGRQSAEFHIEVDWHGGHGEYKKGWPMATWSFPKPIPVGRALSLEFRLRMESAMQPAHIPKKALAYGFVTDAGGEPEWRSVLDLTLREWRTIRAPMLTKGKEIRGLRVYVAESWYRHGDVFSFFFDDITLVEPEGVAVVMADLSPRYLTADDENLTIRLKIAGDLTGARIQGTIVDLQGKTMKRATMLLHGANVVLEVPVNGLPVGHYFAALRIERDVRVLAETKTWLKKTTRGALRNE